MESFEVVGEITAVETIAVGSAIRELARLRRKGNQAETVFGLTPMATRKTTAPRYAICVDNAEYPASLELHKLYRLVSDDDADREGELRVIDESGEDYLYPAKYFVVVDLSQQVTRTLNKSFARGA